MRMKEFTLQTEVEGMYDITQNVCNIIRESGIQNGVCVIHCPHTTAGITINENADPDVKHDILLGLRKAFPEQSEFLHAEGNSTAHLKSSFVGASQWVIIEDGRPLLGIWQGIYFCEFDGPRKRRCYVKLMEDK